MIGTCNATHGTLEKRGGRSLAELGSSLCAGSLLHPCYCIFNLGSSRLLVQRRNKREPFQAQHRRLSVSYLLSFLSLFYKPLSVETAETDCGPEPL